MIRIYAPYPAPKITILLPDPDWGDVQRLESTSVLHRSMNGVRIVTYVRKKVNCRLYELSFELTRPKAEEFINFFKLFGSKVMKLEFDQDTSVVGYLKINPAELEFVKRSVLCTSYESVSVKLSLESVT